MSAKGLAGSLLLPPRADVSWEVVPGAGGDSPILLGVKAATWSLSKASFTCPCYSSNKPRLIPSEAHLLEIACKFYLAPTAALKCWPCFWQTQSETNEQPLACFPSTQCRTHLSGSRFTEWVPSMGYQCVHT